jgi:hypothetical protein
MTEAQWLTSVDPVAMLEALTVGGRSLLATRFRVSDRKLRLFAAACARHAWRHLTDEGARAAVELAESEGASAGALSAARAQVSSIQYDIWANGPDRGMGSVATAEWSAALWACAAVYDAGEYALANAVHLTTAVPPEAQAALLREVIGRLPRRRGGVPRGAVPLTPDARSLAEAAYEERRLPSGHLDAARLSVLSDALEESGCTDAELLAHLRAAGPHVRGCWAVDLVVGKA